MGRCQGKQPVSFSIGTFSPTHKHFHLLQRGERLVVCCCSVAKSYPTLRPHGLQHARLPCPPLSPGVCSNSCLLSQWWYPTISSSIAPFSSCLQSFPASGSFPMSQLFASGGQSIGASASVLPMNIQDAFYPAPKGSLLPKSPRVREWGPKGYTSLQRHFYKQILSPFSTFWFFLFFFIKLNFFVI